MLVESDRDPAKHALPIAACLVPTLGNSGSRKGKTITQTYLRGCGVYAKCSSCPHRIHVPLFQSSSPIGFDDRRGRPGCLCRSHGGGVGHSRFSRISQLRKRLFPTPPTPSYSSFFRDLDIASFYLLSLSLTALEIRPRIRKWKQIGLRPAMAHVVCWDIAWRPRQGGISCHAPGPRTICEIDHFGLVALAQLERIFLCQD